MKKIIINGKFMADRMQGIVRYAREITSELDHICNDMDIELVVPEETEIDLVLENIKVVSFGKHHGIAWEQMDFAKYVRKHKDAVALNYCNVAPIFAPAGITVIHDIMYKVNPGDYSSFRNRLSRMWHVYQYRLVTKREKKVVTVSNFSKSEIERIYPVVHGKMEVVPNGWQHVLKYKDNPNWEEKYAFLSSKQYFFSLSTLAKNKNGKWIIEVAKKNPKEVFAIAGKYYETEDIKIPDNVHMLGFISDEDACSLIKNCRAFIHPSLYEGFGIPPLEALALGAQVISSNSTSLPEVLGKSARYIDPRNTNVSLENILDTEVENRSVALERYAWNKSAEKLLKILREC
ncbi:glycosyltransferase family 4 protein [Lactococcus lactis]|uniref:glycosyltransferase family 4 protein n=1 Tax=Lactococcus lactis TaxID=1358 RepID=UPI000F546B92|nr:glycosyltransferase family 1 protein [Lactococcus lactis]RQE14809.1 glycosyltransferase family 1 protein [Lactococcus lactis]